MSIRGDFGGGVGGPRPSGDGWAGSTATAVAGAVTARCLPLFLKTFLSLFAPDLPGDGGGGGWIGVLWLLPIVSDVERALGTIARTFAVNRPGPGDGGVEEGCECECVDEVPVEREARTMMS